MVGIVAIRLFWGTGSWGTGTHHAACAVVLPPHVLALSQVVLQQVSDLRRHSVAVAAVAVAAVPVVRGVAVAVGAAAVAAAEPVAAAAVALFT